MDNTKWGVGKDDSSINKFPSLMFLSSKMVYYINLNCIYNLERTVIDCWECECDQFSSCRKANWLRDYCNLCSLSNRHFSFEEEKNFKFKHLIEKNISLVDDFKRNSRLNIRTGDYIEKSITFEDGTQYEWSFHHYVFKSPYFKYNTFY